MRFEYNSKFRDLQEMIGIDFVDRLHLNKSYVDLGELIELYQVDGCIFIHNLPEYRTVVDLEFVERCFQDRTGYEVSENHVQLEDLFEPAMSLVERMKFCLSYLCALLAKMKLQFPQYHFQVILTYANEESISVRFHILRPGEPPFPNIDLEDSEDALLVLSN